MVEYSFRFDADHYRMVLAKWRKQNWRMPIVRAVQVVFIGLMLYIAADQILQHRWKGAVVPLLVAGFVACSLPLGTMLAIYRIRKHTCFGKKTLVRMTGEGVHMEAASVLSEINWNAYQKYATFPDGILLFMSPRHCYWLPDSAITHGSKAQAREVVREHIVKHKDRTDFQKPTYRCLEEE